MPQSPHLSFVTKRALVYPSIELTRLSVGDRWNRLFMELYQAEWCPHSHKVRQKLTEIGIDFQARQVPADPDDRAEMQRAVGTNEIPVLLTDEGDAVCGEDGILQYLSRFDSRQDAEVHRKKASEEVPTFAEVRTA